MRLVGSAIAGFLILCAGGAAAAGEDDAVEAALACRSIGDSGERLSCFDKAVAALGAAREQAAADAAAATVARETRKKEDFGLSGADLAKADRASPDDFVARTPDEFGGEAVPEIRRAVESRRLKEITATATSIKVNSIKQATLYLDNGQVWKQLESDSVNINHARSNKSYAVTIKRGAFGNYLATIEGLHRTIRVTRVK
jgi:hypothetical protein